MINQIDHLFSFLKMTNIVKNYKLFSLFFLLSLCAFIGRRLSDKKLGVRLYPNELTKESLEEAIDKCLDVNLSKKFKEISMRVRNENGLDAVCNEIVKYLK